MEEARLIAERKKLTSNDRINNYKKRYRGAGAVFRIATNTQSKVLSRLEENKQWNNSDDLETTPQASRYVVSSKKKSKTKSVPDSFRKSLEVGSDMEHITQSSIQESKEEDDADVDIP